MTASDAVHDAPRFMRLPGSHNSKRGDWLPVEILSCHSELRYRFEALEEWLASAGIIIPRKPKPQKKSNGRAAAFEMAPPGTDTDRRRGAAWAQSALAASAAELANAGEGTRHGTLLAKANRMARMVARGWCDLREVERTLHAAAEVNGQIREYGEDHFATTFRDGSKFGLHASHSVIAQEPLQNCTTG